MKTVRRFCAVLVGVVFFIAGLLKLMDPVGAGLVVTEYFKFLGLGFMAPAAKFVGVAMALLETVIGAALISGVWPKLTGIVTGIVLGAFTILTFVLWIKNPPMDCGCFGEAIHLTHGQSLIKNLILCALWAVAFFPPSKIPVPRRAKYVSFWIALLSVLVFMVLSLRSIPALDFTSFKPGVTLMQAQYGAAEDSPLFSICDSEGEYRDELLAQGAILVFSEYEPEKVKPRDLERIQALMADADSLGVQSLVVISGDEVPDGIYTSDRRTLMTVNRSNGGATLFSDGMVVAQWPVTRLPSAEKIASLSTEDATEAMMKEYSPRRLKMQGFLLYVFAVLLLL